MEDDNVQIEELIGTNHSANQEHGSLTQQITCYNLYESIHLEKPKDFKAPV